MFRDNWAGDGDGGELHIKRVPRVVRVARVPREIVLNSKAHDTSGTLESRDTLKSAFGGA